MQVKNKSCFNCYWYRLGARLCGFFSSNLNKGSYPFWATNLQRSVSFTDAQKCKAYNPVSVSSE